jgi:hypothetical protein
MVDQCFIYSVAQNAKAGLDVKQVGSSPAMATAYRTLLPMSLNGRTYLLGHAGGSSTVDIFQFSNRRPWLTRLPSKLQIAKGVDLINVFLLGNCPYLAAYTAKTGVFNVYVIADDFSLSAPYQFFRNHEPSLSQGFNTVCSFTVFGQVLILGYREDNGYVAMYTVGVAATSPPNTAPLIMTPAWAHQWAKGWTNFAFFQLGGENFFFKTNTWKWNVNIDHVLDNPAAGTVEVGSNMDPAKKLKSVDIVRAFVLGTGDPYFAAYTKGGHISVNRFHGDCQGWTTLAQFKAKDKAAQMCPLVLANQIFLVVA